MGKDNGKKLLTPFCTSASFLTNIFSIFLGLPIFINNKLKDVNQKSSFSCFCGGCREWYRLNKAH